MLLAQSALPDHMAGQIKYFEKENESRPSYGLEPWQKRYVDSYVRIGNPKKKGLIVDNATGSGYIAIELAKRGFRVIATDLTVAELINLKEHIRRLGLTKQIFLICANSEELPVRSKAADGMVANAILEHLPNEKKAIGEMSRVLRVRAPLMLAAPVDLRFVWPFLWMVNIAHDKKIGHLRRYTKGRIVERFKKFAEIKTYYTGSLMKIFCIVMKKLTMNTWWDEEAERLDTILSHVSYGSSNIVSILRKK